MCVHLFCFVFVSFDIFFKYLKVLCSIAYDCDVCVCVCVCVCE